MSKERLETDYALEVIKREILITKGLKKSETVYLPVDAVVKLIDRVQELEDLLNASTHFQRMLRKQNKRYREAIEFGIEHLKNSDIRQVQLVVTALKSALEGEK